MTLEQFYEKTNIISNVLSEMDINSVYYNCLLIVSDPAAKEKDRSKQYHSCNVNTLDDLRLFVYSIKERDIVKHLILSKIDNNDFEFKKEYYNDECYLQTKICFIENDGIMFTFQLQYQLS